MIAALLMLASAVPVLQPQLQPFGFLAGRCWQGEISPGQVDRHCFVVLTDGTLRDRHLVSRRGQRLLAGETIYRWDAEAGAVTFTYRDSVGGQVTGSVRARGNLIGLSGNYTSRGGQRFRVASRWERIGDDAYRADIRSADLPLVNATTVYRRVD